MQVSRKTREALKKTPVTIFKGARRSVFIDGMPERDVLEAIRASASIHEYKLSNDIAARYNLEICCRCAWCASTWSALCASEDPKESYWIRVCAGCAFFISNATAFVPDGEGDGARILEKTNADEELEDNLDEELEEDDDELDDDDDEE